MATDQNYENFLRDVNLGVYVGGMSEADAIASANNKGGTSYSYGNYSPNGGSYSPNGQYSLNGEQDPDTYSFFSNPKEQIVDSNGNPTGKTRGDVFNILRNNGYSEQQIYAMPLDEIGNTYDKIVAGTPDYGTSTESDNAGTNYLAGLLRSKGQGQERYVKPMYPNYDSTAGRERYVNPMQVGDGDLSVAQERANLRNNWDSLKNYLSTPYMSENAQQKKDSLTSTKIGQAFKD